MRFPRVKADGHGFYHCVSRVVEGRFIFQTSGHGSAEAERFVQLMRRLEAFSGVRVLTYALMSNHFHLLCQVPQGSPSRSWSCWSGSRPVMAGSAVRPWRGNWPVGLSKPRGQPEPAVAGALPAQDV